MNGLDNCSMNNFGNLDYNSSLLNESEARNMHGRPDINVFIT